VPPQLPLDAHMDEEDEDAHALLARAHAIAESYGVDVQTCVVHARDAAEAIVEQARRTGVELLVVGGVCGGRRFRGTVRDVLKKAPCRVALIAARAPA
jgi:nucleotide-binding universal stress UspA family protein